ncbi:SDR family oxidoreductase [Glaciimonas soli]|uniref:SDR family NAD(P)-dependent oxidoreductase n=1 Tax=Glaciimonas soli TaxID=2590999 RepID=A0A843YZU4_9BURK|nr:SDR family oxidoreductase [Glaciimonas soli]MQR02066.1 SDR family NAD(P)-dependent oxidoreductase [Glaciimonas soli]
MTLPFQIDLSGRVAVITGGGGVLCAEFGRALASCGAKVALLDLDGNAAERQAAAIRAQGGTAIGIATNVLERPSLEHAAATVLAHFGPCDLLLNGAGGNNPKGTTSKESYESGDLADPAVSSFFDLDQQAVEFVFKLNFMGTLLPTQVFAQQMLDRPGCAIINMSSMNAFRPLTKIPAYSGAKAAISNFTQWLAVHFADAGIRVNAIAPGFFETAQNQTLLIDQVSGKYTERAEKIIAHTPMRRFGITDDLLGTLLWLASPQASGFVNGIVVPVDGGFSAYSGV